MSSRIVHCSTLPTQTSFMNKIEIFRRQKKNLSKTNRSLFRQDIISILFIGTEWRDKSRMSLVYIRIWHNHITGRDIHATEATVSPGVSFCHLIQFEMQINAFRPNHRHEPYAKSLKSSTWLVSFAKYRFIISGNNRKNLLLLHVGNRQRCVERTATGGPKKIQQIQIEFFDSQNEREADSKHIFFRRWHRNE